MIVHEGDGPFGLMVHRWRGSALARIWPLLVLVGALSLGVEQAFARWDLDTGWSLKLVPFNLVGVALSIFLGFRNNACYDRFWEARKAWGALINNSRTFAREVSLYVRGDVHLHKLLVRRQVAFAHALRLRLRGETAWADLAPWVDEEELDQLGAVPNPPDLIQRNTARMLRQAWSDRHLSDYHLAQLEERLLANTDVQGICERIQNTPLPTSYTILTHRIVALYCLLLPFGLHSEVGPLSPIVTVFVAYAFLGLDTIGTEIEDPFGTDPNDLPLSAMCRTIERDLQSAIGEEIPTPLQPVDKVLL